jgi:ATP-binding protein involved in chromosome partitioning
MFEKVGIPILGIVREHGVACLPQLRHESHIFGEGGGAPDVEGLWHRAARPAAARRPRSARRPIRASRRSWPIRTEGFPRSTRQIARRCAIKIADSQKDMTSKFPSIVVQKHLNQ